MLPPLLWCPLSGIKMGRDNMWDEGVSTIIEVQNLENEIIIKEPKIFELILVEKQQNLKRVSLKSHRYRILD